MVMWKAVPSLLVTHSITVHRFKDGVEGVVNGEGVFVAAGVGVGGWVGGVVRGCRGEFVAQLGKFRLSEVFVKISVPQKASSAPSRS